MREEQVLFVIQDFVGARWYDNCAYPEESKAKERYIELLDAFSRRNLNASTIRLVRRTITNETMTLPTDKGREALKEQE